MYGTPCQVVNMIVIGTERIRINRDGPMMRYRFNRLKKKDEGAA
jgi:hypothetical protein